MLLLLNWWNKYYFTWRRCLLHREFYMFIVVCDKSSWEICYQRKRSFLCLLLLMCQDVEKCPGLTESNIQDLFNQKGLKVFHQNIRGLFHNIAKLSTFLHTHKNTHMFFLRETCINSSSPTQLFLNSGIHLH